MHIKYIIYNIILLKIEQHIILIRDVEYTDII